MDESIKKEQKKLADNLANSTAKEIEKKGFALLCWLQGYQTGYESCKDRREQK